MVLSGSCPTRCELHLRDHPSVCVCVRVRSSVLKKCRIPEIQGTHTSSFSRKFTASSQFPEQFIEFRIQFKANGSLRRFEDQTG